jgi:uncharacterized protein DUF6184
MTTFRLSAMGICSALMACSHAPQTQPVTSAEPAATISRRAENPHDSAADRLAAARCDHEQTCGNVGYGKKYTSRQTCIAQVRGSMVNDLGAYDCLRGFDPNAISACVNALGTEDCGHPIDTLATIDKCRHNTVCP